MKRKFFIVMILAGCLYLSACAIQSTDNSSSSNSTANEITNGETSSQPSEAVEEESSGQSTAIDTEVEEKDSALSEKTQSVSFLIAGNNAQGTQLKIDIPQSWTVEGDKIIANEQFVARFEIVSHYDSDAAEYLQNLILEENGNDVVIVELDIPGMVVQYCETQIENADGIMQDGFRYYVCIGKQIASISLVPAPEAEISLQCEEFETYLATLEIQP